MAYPCYKANISPIHQCIPTSHFCERGSSVLFIYLFTLFFFFFTQHFKMRLFFYQLGNKTSFCLGKALNPQVLIKCAATCFSK